jgi:AcrR family transcriptional regulator
MPTTVSVDGLLAGYRQADEQQHRVAEATVRCIGRWGIAKTSLDDIARAAGMSRATLYRVAPGGKERLIATVVCFEVGRCFARIDDELATAGDLADVLTRGITTSMRIVTTHPVIKALVEHEPDRILPHFAFDQLGRSLAVTTELARPHLARHLPDDAIAPAAEWAARLVLTYSIHPSASVDPHDPGSVRGLVETYVMPALARLQEAAP